NPSASDSLETEINVRGARVKSGTAVVLTASDIHARNTFDQRQAVRPRTAQLRFKSQLPVFEFPASSVVRLTLELT
ncbi:MAG: alpha-L-arabinofuranosidase, partial [Acidobacteria bacterium]|nr:alpha-L-arabinofuranosidase [Acidobacteriota bacterium]